MPDRLGLTVSRDGTASIMLLNNQTMIPVRLVTDREGKGGVEFLEYDLEARTATIHRINGEGQTSREISLDGG